MNIPRLALPDATYRWWALAVTIIGNFMSMLDTSIVNIAIPKLMAVFAVEAKNAQWILTAYMLTLGMMQPVSGYFCDRFGTRRMYLFSLTVFTGGSALCGMAWSNDSMVLFRVIQAIGGGLVYPVTMTIVYHNFPCEERYQAMSIWGLSAMVAPAIGPALSGYLVEYWDWRVIFAINVPVGFIGYLLAALILRESVLNRNGKFDAGGFITSSLGLLCLLLALNKGAEEGWTSPYIIALLYVSFASLALFVAIELKSENPLLDLTVFTKWNFTCSSCVLFIGTAGLYGGLFLVPLFMENIRGYTAMQTGVLLLPAALVSGLMMPVAIRIARRVGPKPVVIAGIVILGMASLPFVHLNMDTGYYTILFVMMLRGAGLGLFLMTATTLGMNALPLAKMSRATAMKSMIRQIAGSFGIALLSTVIQHRQAYHLAHIAEYMNAASLPMKQTLANCQDLFFKVGGSPGAAKHMLTYSDSLYARAGFAPGIIQAKALALLSSAVQKQAAIFAFNDAFAVLALICFCGIIPAWLLRSRQKSKN
ncbi:MAG TPA: DHA2 family efflux MFS transporter permease subunit [Methylomusa anaerophila]|uniref:Multidrug export protein EmrB n=1 Tax=Methylomusa anaerophila TaxID=1930071 RepID=A0A348AI52_9FIRM|nr:DHA2 family efflux MFS transporter permease subunit [Methylomusa anaerophila]BBB90750.1 multidrug export protein EmrB [Methylomusa anaerophila]HML88647.1 DHA2 family efflux MFS transporter permease subunit [Methylomusa anaerophila]